MAVSSCVDNDSGAFNRPRTYGGLLLIGIVAVLVTIDAFSLDYDVDPVVLTLLLTTGSLLLGVEVLRKTLNGS